MPPANARENSSSAEDIPPAKNKTSKVAKPEPEEDDDEEPDVELDEDEYVVEKIVGHDFDQKGNLLLEVQWEGYTETTWEPEENLDGCEEELKTYYKEIGGKPRSTKKKLVVGAKGNKKRKLSPERTVSDSPPASTVTPKRGAKRKATDETAATPSPAKEWIPPIGSWEDRIQSVDTIEQDDDGRISVFLLWDDGRRTRHASSVANRKCPQKMLHFYEAHLQFNPGNRVKSTSNEANGGAKDEVMSDDGDEKDIKAVATVGGAMNS